MGGAKESAEKAEAEAAADWYQTVYTPVVKRIRGKDRKARTYVEMLAGLPAIEPGSNDLDRSRVRIGQPGDLGPDEVQVQRVAKPSQRMVGRDSLIEVDPRVE